MKVGVSLAAAPGCYGRRVVPPHPRCGGSGRARRGFRPPRPRTRARRTAQPAARAGRPAGPSRGPTAAGPRQKRRDGLPRQCRVWPMRLLSSFRAQLRLRTATGRILHCLSTSWRLRSSVLSRQRWSSHGCLQGFTDGPAIRIIHRYLAGRDADLPAPKRRVHHEPSVRGRSLSATWVD